METSGHIVRIKLSLPYQGISKSRYINIHIYVYRCVYTDMNIYMNIQMNAKILNINMFMDTDKDTGTYKHKPLS